MVVVDSSDKGLTLQIAAACRTNAERRAPSAERRAPSAERPDCASAAGGRPTRHRRLTAGRPAGAAVPLLMQMPHPPPAGRRRMRAPPSRRAAEALTAPWARARRRPPSPPDRRPPRRGGRPSPGTASAGRPAGFNRQVARRGLFPSAGVLAAAALLALTGALALPVAAEAQTEITLISNVGQGTAAQDFTADVHAQRFTTGSDTSGYTVTGVDLAVPSATSTGFTATVCGVDGDGFPTTTCTALTAPSAVTGTDTWSFTAPSNISLATATTYTLVLRNTEDERAFGAVTSNGEDTGGAVGWSIEDGFDYHISGTWATTSVPHFQDHASDNWEPEGAGSDGVVNRSWSGRRSNMLSWSTCSIW